MKVKKKYFFIRIILYFIILSWYHFFYIIPLPSKIDTLFQIHNFSFITSIIGICLTLYIFYFCKNDILIYRDFFKRYYIVLTISFIIMTLYTLFVYDKQNLFTTIRFGANFLQLFLVPAYLLIMEVDEESNNFIKTLIVFNFIWVIFTIIQSQIYAKNGTLLFDMTTYFNENAYSRTFGIRISSNRLGAFVLLFCFSELYTSKLSLQRRFFYIINIFVTLYMMLFIAQSRADLLYISLSVVVLILIGQKPIGTRIKEICIIILLSIFLFYFGTINTYIDSIQRIEINENNASSAARIYALNYYIDTFINKTFFGNGFVSSGTSTPYFSVEHGERGIAYYSDMGIVGLLAETGLFSIIYFFLPLKKIFTSLKIISKNREKNKVLFAKSYFVYLLLSSLTLVITDNQRVMMFPIIVAYYLHSSKVSNVKVSV